MAERFEEEILDNFQMVRVLKQTDTSQVVHLQHKILHKNIIKRTFEGSPEAYLILKHYHHFNIPNIYDTYVSDEKVTVLEEYIDGISLADILQTCLLTESSAVNICINICDALIFTHSIGIIHRDIKPENIMIANNGTVKLVDWASSRLYKFNLKKDTTILGTTGYAAPEQYGFAQTDGKSDIFSLGITLNVMLTGQHPSVRMYNGALGKVIRHCTDIQPDKRYNAHELKKVLLCIRERRVKNGLLKLYKTN